MKKKLFPKIDLKQFGMLIALVVIIIMFAILTEGRSLKPMNIANLINQNAYVVILRLTM